MFHYTLNSTVVIPSMWITPWWHDCHIWKRDIHLSVCLILYSHSLTWEFTCEPPSPTASSASSLAQEGISHSTSYRLASCQTPQTCSCGKTISRSIILAQYSIGTNGNIYGLSSINHDQLSLLFEWCHIFKISYL